MVAFWIAPISKMKLALSYLIAAWIMGSLLCLFTFGISQVYIVCIGGMWLTPLAVLKMIGIIILNVFSSSCFVFFLIVFIHASSTLSAVNTIVGTLVGFIGGIYLPMGLLPEAVQKRLKFFPILHGASLVREIYVADALEKVFENTPIEVMESTPPIWE